MKVLSAINTKKVDSYCINNIGIPSIVLMENAAEQVKKIISNKGNHFLVLCGEGNNGGDGLAIARKLFMEGKEVCVVICNGTGKRTEDFLINYNILNNIGVEILQLEDIIERESFEKKICYYDVIIDCIFGIGLNRDIKGNTYKLIDMINKKAKYKVSVDIPSGIDGNTGMIKGICVEADKTVTIETYKQGFFLGEACNYLGEIDVVKIGFLQSVIDKFSEGIDILDKAEYENMIVCRKKNGHKGDYGKILILAGSKRYTGAAYIASESAVRSGGGLITLIADNDIKEIMQTRLTEAMVINYEDKDLEKLIKTADIIACGPGLGQTEKSKGILKKVIDESECNLVIDADAINIISKDSELLKQVRGRAVFTPHSGEMARLTGKSIKEVNDNRINICREFAKTNDVVVLLKGYKTIIASESRCIVNPTGNSKMATGGMGDCLTGMIAALIGQEKDIFIGTILAAYVHGLIGDELAKERYSINARDIIKLIPETLNKLQR